MKKYKNLSLSGELAGFEIFSNVRFSPVYLIDLKISPKTHLRFWRIR